MFLPYSVDVPMERWPIANWVLIGVITFCSIGAFIDMSGARDTRLEKIDFNKKDFTKEDLYALTQAPSIPGALTPGRFSFLQLWTHLFVHGDILHLLGNMMFLFVFGNAVDAKLGHARFVAIFLLLGAVGGLGWLVLGRNLPLVGASGAIMGIMGVFLVLFPRNDVSILTRGGSFDISAYWVIGIYLLLDLWSSMKAGDSGVAYIVHLVGGAAGIGLGCVLVYLGWVKSTRYEQNLLELLGIVGKENTKRRSGKIGR